MRLFGKQYQYDRTGTLHFLSKISPYFCPRFQNDAGSEVWGFCVFYRQDAGIGFLPCCKWRSVSAHRSLTRLIHFLFKFRKYAPHTLNQRSPAEGKGKGQKLLAQGIALGIQAISKAPCKGKSFVYCLVFEGFCPYYYICTWKNKEVKIFISANFC